MLTIANKGGYMVKKCQKPVYVICEGSLTVSVNIGATAVVPVAHVVRYISELLS